MTNDVYLSNELYERTKAVIPGGIYGHYGYPLGRQALSFFQRVRVHDFGTLTEMNTSTRCVPTDP